MAYQSLYRRYRPQKFSEIRGQPHIVSALKNAVAKNEVGHAYLFHGPRGTGKTTSARVLAKALNCENLGDDSEPCGTCESCVSIEKGRSFDLHELDAASNNRVDDMRELLAKVNLGNPGKAKVYILDEVHMLTPGAENALLKTLEEPPDHVIWVLATTEPHKVVQTIRSRCQVFELNLLGAEEMTDHVKWVIDDAQLDVEPEAINHVVSAGGGSVRDTLSALDRVVAAGGVVELDESADLLVAAIADRDASAALAAVDDATGRGRNPRLIGESVLAGLRDAFLTAMGSPPPRITAVEANRAEEIAAKMSPAAMTRALETLGTSLVEMRQAPDPRVDLEVALVRLCRPDADRSVEALTERIDQLEAQLRGLSGQPAPALAPNPEPAPEPTEKPEPATKPEPETKTAPALPSLPTPPPSATASDTESRPKRSKDSGPAAAARRALSDSSGRPSAAAAPAVSKPAVEAPPTVPTELPSPPVVEETDSPSLIDLRSIQPTSPRHVVELADQHLSTGADAVVKLATELLGPADGPRPAEDLARLWVALVERRDSVEGDAVEVAEIVEVAEVDDPDDIDPTDLIDAQDRAEEVVDRLTEAFPGAELHVPEETDQ